MRALHTSPLGPELDAAREDGAADVRAVASGRRRAVSETRLPDAEVSPRERSYRQAIADLFGDRDIQGDR